MFPLSAVLFPGAGLPLHVFEPRYREMTDACLAGDGEFGVVLIARGSEVGGGDQRYGVGTVAHIEEASRFDDGRWALVAEGRRRITVAQWLADDPYPQAEVIDFPDEREPADEEQFARATAAVRRVRTLLSELGAPAPVMADLGAGGGDDADNGPDDGWRQWRLCAAAPLTALDSQRVLEAAGPGTRLTLLTELCDALAGDLAQLLGRGPAD
jgi:Lon protease-like protein